MRRKIKKYILFCFMCLFLFSFGATQYYYFSHNEEYNQGCDESLPIYINTENINDGVYQGRLLIKMDADSFAYETSDSVSLLKLNLFEAGNVFDNYTNPSLLPKWWDFDSNVLEIDRYTDISNGENGFIGTEGLFGTLIKLIPEYNSVIYTGYFSFIYDGSTVKTVLSNGEQVINPISQNNHLTGTIMVQQKPCVNDTLRPSIQDYNYSNGDTKIINQGLDLNFGDSVNQGDVPYVWNNGVWTGNQWSINNQYGIDTGSLSITIAGNDDHKIVNGGDLNWIGSNKTWQDKDRDFRGTLAANDLFDFGIEKRIDIYYTIKDRVENTTTLHFAFNQPKDAWVDNLSPLNNQEYVKLEDKVSFKVSDDWAGVDSGSVVLILSGTDNDFFGEYSGTDLVFEDVAGGANNPDYNVSLENHIKFPSSGEIAVSVYAVDNEGNGGNLKNWTFITRPDCVELGCCDRMIQTGDDSTREYYPESQIYISGGNNASFTGIGLETGYIDCNTENEGLSIYNGHGDNNTGILIGFTDLSELNFNGTNVKAILSGNTLLLTRIAVEPPPSGGGGGGGSVKLIRDDCPDGDNSFSYYDGSCGSHTSADFCAVDQSNYSSELKGAYIYSYMYGITTMCPIQEANINGYLQRNHFSKMISEFSMNVLGKEPAVGKTGCSDFDDTSWDTEELQGFITTACELNLMGLNSDGKTPAISFNGGNYVTRAQFGTVFSRLLFGDEYNVSDESGIYKQEGYRYKDHLMALKDNSIMTKIDGDWPNILELRGWVMLMMQRADNYGVFMGVIPALNGTNALFD